MERTSQTSTIEPRIGETPSGVIEPSMIIDTSPPLMFTLSHEDNHQEAPTVIVEMEPPSSSSACLSPALTTTAPTLTAASAAPPSSSPPHAVVTMPSNQELLLRDWDDDSHHHHLQPYGCLDLPPVAPAVVLNEASTGSTTGTAAAAAVVATGGGDGSGSGGLSPSTGAAQGSSSNTSRGYSYPVATFVSNFVRSSVSEIRDHIISVTAIPEDVTSNWRTPTAATANATTTTSSNNNNDSDNNNNNTNENIHPHTRDVILPPHEDPFAVFHTLEDPPRPPIETMTRPTSSTSPHRPAAAHSDALLRPQRNEYHPRLDPNLTTAPTLASPTAGEPSASSSASRFVLIDGDLVAIPAVEDQYIHDYDTRPGRQQRQERRQQKRKEQQLMQQKKKQEQQLKRQLEKWKSQAHNSGGSSSSLMASAMAAGEDDVAAWMVKSSSSHDQDPNGTTLSNQGASRVHRGMRKVTKWMRKKNWIPNGKKEKDDLSTAAPSSKINNDNTSSHLLDESFDGREGDTALQSPVPSPSEFAYAVPSAAANIINTAKPRKKSPPRGPNVKRRSSRLIWPMRDQSSAAEAAESHPSSGGRDEGTEVELLPASSLRLHQMGSNVSVMSGDSSVGASTSTSLQNTVPPVASLQTGSYAMAASRAIMPAALLTTLASHGHYRFPSDNNSNNNIAPISASLLLLSEPESPSMMNRQTSIAAEYVGFVPMEHIGTTDNILPDHVLAAEAYIEDRLDEYDKYDKKDMPRSMVPRDADFKVDKLDAPCVDSMLRRAGELAQDMNEDEELIVEVPAMASTVGGVKRGKSDGQSVPLSMATGRDTFVHNDILKLVVVGDARVDKSSLARSLRQATKKPRKTRKTTLGVEVHSWTPLNDDNVQFTVWDVQGASADASPFEANFGAHYGTQSLFFTDRTLYLLVWDLAGSNRKTYRWKASGDPDDSEEDEDDEEDGDDNERLREEANRQADMALEADIEERILSWVDCIARSGHQSAILPIAMVSGDMSPEEATRRCDVMQRMMTQHTQRMEKKKFPKVLSGAETVFCVSLETDMGMDLLRETILAIANDASHSVFDHVGTQVPLGTTMVLETCRRLKLDHKLVLVNHLLGELALLKGEMGMILSVEEVMEALDFLSCIGECLYFGGTDDILSHYVILSRKWLVSALSCVLRNDLKRELTETRRFMNMQSFYSDLQFPENPVTQTFSTSSSDCPLLSSSDTKMLWQSMSFMREAADISSQHQTNNTTSSTMFGFLERLLVHKGVFLPLDIDRFTTTDVVYFVPSLLAQAKARDVWTYKSSESWMTTLAHSWLFRTPTMERDGLMEQVTVGLLRDLYEFSHVVASRNTHSPPHRSQTFPFAQNSMADFIHSFEGEAVGRIKIHHMMCWKNSLLVKIGCMFPDGTELRESFVEIFVTVADPTSPHCVASNIMQSSMQRLIISAKGQVGHHGRKLWRGGYRVVLDSVKASVADCANVDLQVVCPECLAHSHPSSASTLSWDAVRAAADSGSSVVRCMHGHRVDSILLSGTVRTTLAEGLHGTPEGSEKSVKDIFSSVVLVALYDPKTQSVKNVGSGFIVDKKQGLVVTAGHILFNMEPGRHFGTPFFGIKNAMVLIGIITEEKAQNNDNVASFRYIAEIAADDIHSIDACVVKIVGRFARDVDDESAIAGQPINNIVDIAGEHLPSLKTTKRFEIEENVRILGFNQGGEGLLEMGKHVNRSADLAKGYICKQFKLSEDKSDCDSDDSSSGGDVFLPREEIVVSCKTIPGHSGSPAVNSGGTVVGILSRADPVDPTRCYLAPSSELKILVNKARKTSCRVGGLKLAY